MSGGEVKEVSVENSDGIKTTNLKTNSLLKEGLLQIFPYPTLLKRGEMKTINMKFLFPAMEWLYYNTTKSKRKLMKIFLIPNKGLQLSNFTGDLKGMKLLDDENQYLYFVVLKEPQENEDMLISFSFDITATPDCVPKHNFVQILIQNSHRIERVLPFHVVD